MRSFNINITSDPTSPMGDKEILYDKFNLFFQQIVGNKFIIEYIKIKELTKGKSYENIVDKYLESNYKEKFKYVTQSDIKGEAMTTPFYQGATVINLPTIEDFSTGEALNKSLFFKDKDLPRRPFDIIEKMCQLTFDEVKYEFIKSESNEINAKLSNELYNKNIWIIDEINKN
jgi:hypothetical protein